MANGELVFTLWDVRHGISIWINTPNGCNHWIDLGSTPDFSPSLYVRHHCGIEEIDFLVISHPDRDHLEDLPQFREAFNAPKVLCRNKYLPDEDMFGQGTLEYQKIYAEMHLRFTYDIPPAESPTNPDRNGGVQYAIHFLDHGILADSPSLLGRAPIKGNDTSLVVMLLYQGVLFVCPGDIGPPGWRELWRSGKKSFQTLIKAARIRLLVAPHHGRESGYCDDMMDAVQPDAIFISDAWGQSPTHRAFREKPYGIRSPSGEVVRYYTTKRGGAIQAIVSSVGAVDVYQHNR